MPFDQTTALDEMVKRTLLRFRFDKADNFLSAPPLPEELQAAVLDGVSDINSFEPETSFTFEQFCTGIDPRWAVLLYFAAGKNLANLLYSHWIGEGQDASLGDLHAPDRTPNYETLLSKLTEEFDKRVERLKKASQKFIRGISGVTPGTSILYPFGTQGFTNIFASRLRIR